MQREFTGVFIPAHIWESQDLIPAEKMLLGEIAALSTRYGYCSAGRKHFANWLHCSVENVSYYFSKLQKMGFIIIEREAGGTNKIRLVNDRFFWEEKAETPPESNEGVVNGIYGGSKRDLRGGVNGVYPKYNNKENRNNIVVEGDKKTSIEAELEMALKTEKENLKGGAPAAGAWAEFDAVIERLKDDDLLKAAFGMNAKCPIDKYPAYLLEFQVKAKGEHGNAGYPEKTKLESGMRKHFINWSRIKQEEEERKKNQQSQKNGRQYASNRATVNNFGADEEAYKKPQLF